MDELVQTALKDLQKIHSVYSVTFGLLMLNLLAAPEPFGASVEIFGILVIVEKYSVIVGLLFGVFVVAVLSKSKQLQRLLALSRKRREAEDAIEYLHQYPWTLSPFQEVKLGRQGFWASLIVGLVYIAMLGTLHVIDPEERGLTHQIFGVVDLVIVFLSVLALKRLLRCFKEIKGEA